MRHRSSFGFLQLPFWGLGGLFIGCCEELPPGLILHPPDVPLTDTCYIDSTALTPDDKVVLLEEFTGVHCSNCPPGHVMLANIIASHDSGDVIGISIHNGHPLAEPYPPPQPDFRTDEGIDISALVKVGGIPTGVIDRQDFAGDGTPTESVSKWAGFVDSQLTEVPPVNIAVSVKNYDDVTRQLIVNVKAHFTQAVSGQYNISVMVVESDITAWQLLQNLTVDSTYTHNHILRGMMTSYLGEAITCPVQVGLVVEKDFAITLDPAWVAGNCEVVVFVNENTGWNVLQAAAVHVQ
jgi:hypothetical protein